MTLSQISLGAALILSALPTPAMGQANVGAPGVKSEASYRLKGDRALMPLSISDDGIKTYLSWPATAELPAIFIIDETGKEAMVDAFVRGGFLVIDAVPARLVFRLDRQMARAERMKRR